jgi:hypothetical protein
VEDTIAELLPDPQLLASIIYVIQCPFIDHDLHTGRSEKLELLIVHPDDLEAREIGHALLD